MKTTSVVLFVVFTGTLVSISKPAKAKSVSGQETVNGVTCNYNEIRNPGKGPRGIRLCCSKVKKRCEYYGANPHHCGNAYNNDQVRYYKKLALSAMKNGAPCAQKEIEDKVCNLIYPCTAGDCLPGNNALKRRLPNRETGHIKRGISRIKWYMLLTARRDIFPSVDDISSYMAFGFKPFL